MRLALIALLVLALAGIGAWATLDAARVQNLGRSIEETQVEAARLEHVLRRYDHLLDVQAELYRTQKAAGTLPPGAERPRRRHRVREPDHADGQLGFPRLLGPRVTAREEYLDHLQWQIGRGRNLEAKLPELEREIRRIECELGIRARPEDCAT